MSSAVSGLGKQVFERIAKSTTYGSYALKNVSLISAGSGRCKAEFVVQENQLNLGGTLHGGLTSGLVDVTSTIALMTHGTGAPGVSIDMHITFLKAAFPGETVLIDAKTIRAGRTIAFLEVEFTKPDGSIVARGQHTKFLGGSKQ